MMGSVKKCTKCGETKELGLFAKRRSSSDGTSSWCRLCATAAQASYVKRAHKDVIVLAKSVPCMDCGVSYPPYVMDFDHRPGEVKSFSVGEAAGRTSAYSIKKEIAKCDVVCANCHRERTYKRRNINP